HLSQHADGRAAAMHPSHETRVNIAGCIRDDEVGEFPIYFVEIGRLTWKVVAKTCANAIRYRLPDRALPDVGDVVDHIIEHAMTLRANSVPVLRIERLARFRCQERFAQGFCHAACSRRAWRHSIAANASKIARI